MGSQQLTAIADESLATFVSQLGALWHGAGAVSALIPDLCGGFAPGTILQYNKKFGILCGICLDYVLSGAFMMCPKSGRLLVLEYGKSAESGGYLELARPYFMSTDFCFTKIGGIRIVDPEDECDYISLRSPWLNVSDHMGLFGVYGGDNWGVWRDGSSDGQGRYRCRFLWSEDSDAQVQDDRPETDCAWLLCCDIDSATSRNFFEDGRARELTVDGYLSRAVWLRFGVTEEYVFAANFSEDTCGEFLLPPGDWFDSKGGQPSRGYVKIDAADCCLWVKNAR